MSAEFDELVASIADLEDLLATTRSPDETAAINRALDAFMMALGAVESRLNMLEYNAAKRQANEQPRNYSSETGSVVAGRGAVN